MRLAEGVATGDQRDGFFVVHRHPAERFADVPRRCQRIGVAIGTFGVDVDEPHLHGGEGSLQIAPMHPAVGIVV